MVKSENTSGEMKSLQQSAVSGEKSNTSCTVSSQLSGVQPSRAPAELRGEAGKFASSVLEHTARSTPLLAPASTLCPGPLRQPKCVILYCSSVTECQSFVFSHIDTKFIVGGITVQISNSASLIDFRKPASLSSSYSTPKLRTL